MKGHPRGRSAANAHVGSGMVFIPQTAPPPVLYMTRFASVDWNTRPQAPFGEHRVWPGCWNRHAVMPPFCVLLRKAARAW